MKNIILANDIPKEYNPKNFGELAKIIMSEVPLGGAVTQLVSSIEQRNQTILLEELQSRLLKVEEKLRDLFASNIVKEEEFFYYSLVKSKSCYNKKQLEKLAEIIIASLTGNEISVSEAEIMIDIVSESNTSERRLFYWIYQTYLNQVEKDERIEKLDIWELKKESIIQTYVEENINIEGLLSRLVSKGLLNEVRRESDAFWRKGGEISLDLISYSYTHYGRLWLKIIYGLK